MVNKININPEGIPPDGAGNFDWPDFEACYNDVMDSSFAALSRNIVLHLTPKRIIDTSGVQASTNALHYSPFGGRAPRRAPNIISTTRQPSVIMTYRDVTYPAHIKHGPISEDDNNGIVLARDEVQLTTVIESLDHIGAAETATIDGQRYTLEWTRSIGLQQLRYVISKWKRINEQENA